MYPAKCDTMEKRAAALGITCLRTAARDASKPCPAPLKGRFDRVVCDVPCSGLGAIRRKPEIRYKDLETFKDLPELQYRILVEAAALTRPGGVLQYSTCTLNPAENEQVAERFLRENPAFSPRMLPLSDGFAAGGQAVGAYPDAVPAYASYGRVLPGGLCADGRLSRVENGWCV